MKKTKVALLGLAVVALLTWALPAFAQRGTATATVVKVTAGKPTEFKFTLSPKSVSAGTVTFQVTNGGAIVHDFKIAGKKTPNLSPGQSAKLTVTLKAGSYPYLCTVSGHAAAGMKGTLKVT